MRGIVLYKFINSRRSVCGYIMVFVILTILTVFVVQNIKKTDDLRDKLEHNFVKLDKARLYNETFDEEHTLPTSIPSVKRFNIDVDMSKYSSKGTPKTIITQLRYSNLSIYAGDEKIFERRVKEDALIKSGASKVIVYEVPHIYDNAKLRLEYERAIDTLAICEVFEVYFGDKSSILSHKIEDDFLTIVIAVLMILIFFIVFILSIVGEFSSLYKQNRFLHLALLGLVYGCYILPQLFIFNYMMRRYSELVYVIEFSSLVAITLPTILIVKNDVDKKFAKYYSFTTVFIIASMLIQYLLTVLGIIEFREMLLFTQVTLFVSMFLMLVTIIKTDGKEYPAKANLVVSIIPIIVCVTIALSYFMINGVVIFKEVITLFAVIFIVIQVKNVIRDVVNYQKSKIQAETYKDLAFNDTLTSLSNRTAYNQYISEIGDSSIWIVSIDIDNLKLVNDLHGHLIGDKMLKAFADVLLEKLTESYKAFRIGGDEFIVFMDEDEDFVVADWAKELRSAIANDDFSKQYDKIEFSLGACYYRNDLYAEIDAAIGCADKAMYAEKLKHKM